MRLGRYDCNAIKFYWNDLKCFEKKKKETFDIWWCKVLNHIDCINNAFWRMILVEPLQCNKILFTIQTVLKTKYRVVWNSAVSGINPGN